MRLKLYDAMWLIHYGSSSVRYRGYTYAGYPLGGVKFLVKNIMDDLWRGNRVMVCFDSKTNKNALMANYKSNRPYMGYIISQSSFAYNALMRCGITSLKQDGLEGDDLVASAVTAHRKNYSEIIIVSNDRDTAHNVFDNVRVEACSADGIDINERNFIVAAAKNPIAYNTLSAYKVLTGDNSDTVPMFKADLGKKGSAMYTEFVAFLEAKIPNTANKPYISSKREILEYFLKDRAYLTDRDRDELEARMNVIFPTIVDIKEVPCFDGDNLDRQEIAKLLSILAEDDILQQFKLTKVKISAEELNQFKASAQMLRDDTFAIENDCPIHNAFVLDDQDYNMRLFE